MSPGHPLGIISRGAVILKVAMPCFWKMTLRLQRMWAALWFDPLCANPQGNATVLAFRCLMKSYRQLHLLLLLVIIDLRGNVHRDCILAICMMPAMLHPNKFKKYSFRNGSTEVVSSRPFLSYQNDDGFTKSLFVLFIWRLFYEIKSTSWYKCLVSNHISSHFYPSLSNHYVFTN